MSPVEAMQVEGGLESPARLAPLEQHGLAVVRPPGEHSFSCCTKLLTKTRTARLLAKQFIYTKPLCPNWLSRGRQPGHALPNQAPCSAK